MTHNGRVQELESQLSMAQNLITHLEAMLELKIDALRVRDAQLEESRQVAREKAARVAELEAQVRDTAECNAEAMRRMMNMHRRELEAAQKRIAAAHEIIGGLIDVQNGCPLPKYERDFDLVNDQAKHWLEAQASEAKDEQAST